MSADERPVLREDNEWFAAKWATYPEGSMAPGRVDVQVACDSVYGDVVPYPQFTCLLKFRLGGPDPIDYTNAYESTDRTHWHYISQGFTNLYDTPVFPTYREGYNGFGFELTMRIAKAEGEDIAPILPFRLFQKLAKYMLSSGKLLGNGHVIPNLRTLLGDPTYPFAAVAICPDPQMPVLLTSRGRVDFLQLIPIYAEELAVLGGPSDVPLLLEFIKGVSPLLVGIPGRPSVHEQFSTAAVANLLDD